MLERCQSLSIENDDVTVRVDELLRSRRDSAFTSKSHLLRRHPKKTAYRQSEFYEAMEELLIQNGSLEMMAVLLSKSKEAKPSIQLPILKSNGTSKDVNGLLKLACKHRNSDMVSIISTHADSFALNECLKFCLTERDLESATALLQNDADPVDCGDIFLACARNAGCQDLETITLLCSSNKKVSPATLDLALEFATMQGNLEMVVTLLKGGANGDKSGVLGRAVRDGKISITSALILSSRPPTPMSLDKAIPIALESEDSVTRETLIEILLCGGAQGPAVNQALITAVHENIGPLVHHLITHGASVTFNGAEALTTAISLGYFSVACALLGGKMNPQTASHVLSMLPGMDFCLSVKQKTVIVAMLVDCGAYGDALGVALVDAVSKQQVEIVDNLLENDAPVGFNNAQALRHAIIHQSAPLLDRLLQRCHSSDSLLLGTCFPILSSLPPDSQLKTTRKLLDAGATGPAVDEALAAIVSNPSYPERGALLEEYVGHGADVNVGNGKCFVHAAAEGDILTLSLLLSGRPSPEALAQAILPACQLQEATRLTVLDLLLSAGARGPVLDQGLLALLNSDPIEIPVIALLLEIGGVDVNVNDGFVLEYAARQGNHELLCVLLRYRPTQSSLDNAFRAAMKSSTDAETQYTICQTLLAAGVTGEPVSDALIAVQNSQRSHPLLLELLVTSGADINHRDGTALRKAIEMRDGGQIALLLSSSKPLTSDTLYMALTALSRTPWAEKCHIARTILDIGRRRSSDYINKILIESIKTRAEFAFIQVLIEFGSNINYRDGIPLRHAIEAQDPELVELLLEQKITPSTLETAFQSSMRISGSVRTSFLEKIFAVGYVCKQIDSVLVKAVKENPCETQLVELLLDHGASVHFNENEPLIHAAISGDVQTLTTLIAKSVNKTAATSVLEHLVHLNDKWVSERGVEVVKILLENGATGTILSEVLCKFVELSAIVPRSATFVDLLLQYGADPNHGDGQALCLAVANGNAEILQSLLSLERVLPPNLSRAFTKLFSSSLPEDIALRLFHIFLQPPRELSDLTGPEPCSEGFLPEPITFTTLNEWPSGADLLNAILEAGASAETTMPYIIDTEEGVEQVSLLLWALLQPSCQISVEVIATILKYGGKYCNSFQLFQRDKGANSYPANVNFQSSRSSQSPLLVAASSGRPEVVRMLLERGAAISAPNHKGHTPLFLATRAGDHETMRILINAGAVINDGSLHEAARELDTVATALLMVNGHDPNFASLLHYGRTALAELCLYSSASPKDYGRLHDTIRLLIANQADFTVRVQEKPLIFHAMDNSDAGVEMTRFILSNWLWEGINDDSCLYYKDGFIYSPLAYVSKGLCQTLEPDVLLQILKDNGCKYVYYQEDKVNLAVASQDMVGNPRGT